MNANILKYPFKTKIATKEDIIKAIEHTYREKNISVLSFYSSDLNLIIDGFIQKPIIIN